MKGLMVPKSTMFIGKIKPRCLQGFTGYALQIK